MPHQQPKIYFLFKTEHFLLLVGWCVGVVVPQVFFNRRLSGSAFSFSSHQIFIVLVSIFIENWTFLNFSGVWRGCGCSMGRPLSGHTFSDLLYRILSRMMSYERQWLIVSFYFMTPLPLPCQKYGKKAT